MGLPPIRGEAGISLVNRSQRALSGAPELEHVFADHARFVWRVLVRLGVARADVADACQEVFLVVHRRLSEFDERRASLHSWLYGICLRVASEHRRRRPQRREAPLERAPELTTAATPESALLQRRAWERLAAVLSQLDGAKREVFVLYELEQLPMPEVAALLGCPLQTAYSRLHAARRVVLAAFAEYAP